MSIANEHNLPVRPAQSVRPFGIRVKLRRGDPFRLLLGDDWQQLHWFASGCERDAALTEMSRRHQYSRIGDEPAMLFEKVERLAESRAR